MAMARSKFAAAPALPQVHPSHFIGERYDGSVFRLNHDLNQLSNSPLQRKPPSELGLGPCAPPDSAESASFLCSQERYFRGPQTKLVRRCACTQSTSWIEKCLKAVHYSGREAVRCANKLTQAGPFLTRAELGPPLPPWHRPPGPKSGTLGKSLAHANGMPMRHLLFSRETCVLLPESEGVICKSRVVVFVTCKLSY